jgi:CheY-like chemotaxis protein
MSAKSVILLAEDRTDDVELIRRAFAAGRIDNPLFVVDNGEEAVAYLKGEGKYQTRDEYPLPDLLLLDLKMPRMDGFEVLRWVRLQPGLSSLLVVVLTSSQEIRDVNKAYQLGANSFLVKPHDFEQFAQTCHVLKEYWLNLNKGPEARRLARPKSKP